MVRHLLRIIAAIWLACQLAGVCAAPILLAAAPLAAADDDAPCCPGLLPGQICPMHHTREGVRKCLMRNACGRTDASLVAMTFTVGILPQAAGVNDMPARVRALRPAGASAIARPDRPEPPPPRA